MRLPAALRIVPVLAPVWGTTVVVLPATAEAAALTAALVAQHSTSSRGRPTPPGATTTTRAQARRPGTRTSADGNPVDATATFRAGGTYVLRRTADDTALKGTGSRVAESFDGGAPRAPVLHVEYTV